MTDIINCFFKEAQEKGLETKAKVPMCEYTTFKVGGNADLAVFPKSKAQLITAVETAKRYGIPFYVVGKGSNLLVADEGYRGLVVFTGKMNSFSFDETSATVVADAGVNLASLSKSAADRGMSGLEFACGIPGTVGGAVYMNAGAYGSEMKNVTVSTSYWSPEKGEGSFEGEENLFDYRRSVYMDFDGIILGCKLALVRGDREEITAQCRELLAKRREKQPLEYPSAGSTFKRYPGRFTGQMIEEAGLKGFGVGGAEVSCKHAGFVINKGGATAGDIIELVKRVKETVYEKEGVEIECEIRYLAPEGEKKL